MIHMLWFAFLGKLNDLSEPNPKYFQDKVQQETTHQRNKAILIFHIIAAIVVSLQILLKQSSFINGMMSISTSIFAMAMVAMSYHFHPETMKIAYNLLIGAYGPLVLWYNEEGTHRAWIGTQMYPTLILFCTRSVWHFVFHSGLQLVLLHTIYQSAMLKTLHQLTPEEFTRSLTKASTTLGIMTMIITFCIDIALQSAFDRVEVAEKKKREVEKQKLFLLSFSHELRNLINSLMGNMKLASSEMLSDTAKKFLKNADVCGELLLHLINNILDTGKVEVGEFEINPTSTNIFKAIERTWSVCSELIRSKNLQGKLKVARDLPKYLLVDHYRLMQVFLNLIGNAVKFTDRGTIDISIEWIGKTENVTSSSFEPLPFDDENEGVFEKNKMFSDIDDNFLTLSCHQTKFNRCFSQRDQDLQKGLLKVSICDTGNGMSSEDMEKLFQKFTQVSSDTSKRKLGTGLGLFITREICERMGGQIKVFSKDGKGSCFIFCIPLQPLPNKCSSSIGNTIKAEKNHNKRELKAIIVDDEPFSQAILNNFCDKLNVEVLATAENGLQGYRKYVKVAEDRNEPLLVTMDLTMSIMNGKEAAARIRQFEVENEKTPCLLVVISGNCSQSEIAECMDTNGKIRANAFIRKPARIDELHQVISNYFNKDHKK